MNGQNLVFESPFCARRLMVSADDRAVDHLNLIRHRFAFVQRIQDQVPKARDGPASELAINARPFAELFRQIAPLRAGARNPENPVQNLAVVICRSTASPSYSDDERFKERPFRVLHQQSRQSCLPQKATLNQNSGDLEIRFVNRT